MAKSPDAFRTISEVAEWLDIQAHVLRFWESKFTQVKPIKRAGGRRYYRPVDMLLLGGIKQLLHDDGLTIKGVQKILREEGVAHVSALSRSLDDTEMTNTGTIEAVIQSQSSPAKLKVETVEVIELETLNKLTPDETPQTAQRDEANDSDTSAEIEPTPHEAASETPEPSPVTLSKPDTPSEAGDTANLDDVLPTQDKNEPEIKTAKSSDDEISAKEAGLKLPDFLRNAATQDGAVSEDAPSDNMPPPQALQDIQSPMPDLAAEELTEITDPEDPPLQEAEESPPKPRVLDLPAFTAEADFDVKPAVLTASAKIRQLSADQAADIAPLLAQLSKLQNSMTSAGKGSASAPKA